MDHIYKKHAYLIIAHKSDFTFSTLLKMLDDSRNDIFVHMDIKNEAFNPLDYKTKYSHLYFTTRTSVTWGGYSQILSELILLEAAVNTDTYSYYHLLSGEDLPIKSQNYIHNFFERNHGTEYVRFEKAIFDNYDRISYYYPFQEKDGRNLSFPAKLFRFLQKNAHIHRNRNITFQKGSNWFSITDSLARYVVSNKSFIRKVFRNTRCADEVFLQTLIINSDYYKMLPTQDFNNQNFMFMRLIDWDRGTPYIFRESDFDELVQSDMLFARKFSADCDAEIIKMISDTFGVR